MPYEWERDKKMYEKGDGLKGCWNCRKRKSVAEFTQNQWVKSFGLRRECKSCQGEAAPEWKEEWNAGWDPTVTQKWCSSHQAWLPVDCFSSRAIKFGSHENRRCKKCTGQEY